MPFRYFTKQRSFCNYNSPFPNVKPDANVNIYNINDNSDNQFFDIFSDISNSFDHCKKFFDKINKNRDYFRTNKTKENENNNINKIIIEENKMEIDQFPIKQEQEQAQKIMSSNIDCQEIKYEKEEASKKIRQREIFINSKQVSPLLDRLGRIMTDVGSFMFHNMKNYKLEE